MVTSCNVVSGTGVVVGNTGVVTAGVVGVVGEVTANVGIVGSGVGVVVGKDVVEAVVGADVLFSTTIGVVGIVGASDEGEDGEVTEVSRSVDDSTGTSFDSRIITVC